MESTNFQTRLMNLQPNMLTFAMTLTANQNAASELLQETMQKAIASSDSYVETVSLKSWVFSIMRKTFVNKYRSVVCHVSEMDRTEEYYHLNVAQCTNNAIPEGTATAGEVSEAIAEIPETYRRPFAMHVQGYKCNEIAEEMGLSKRTVKDRIIFAGRKLQNLFAAGR